MIFPGDSSISMDVRRIDHGARSKGLTMSLADENCQSMGERGAQEETLVPQEEMTELRPKEFRVMCGYGGHNCRVAAKQVG